MIKKGGTTTSSSLRYKKIYFRGFFYEKEDKAMDFLELAKARYSCKKFSDKPVEKEKLEQVLEAGRLAPTAKNNQPQHIYVLSSKESQILCL